jgi:diaminopimelate epimerase
MQVPEEIRSFAEERFAHAGRIFDDGGAVDARVTVELPGGSLIVDWEGRGTPAWLSGPARKVFEGTISL